MNELRERLVKAEKLILSSKAQKFISIPFKYVYSFVYRKLYSGNYNKATILQAEIISGDKINILFPSANDIYLFGCKSHDSELRLTWYLLNSLKPNHLFIDAGAHFGFYSILAARIMENKGKVLAFEPSTETFTILNKNINAIPNVQAMNMAVYKEETVLAFYQYPVLQSEYNTAKPIENLTSTQPLKIEVKATSIDAALTGVNVTGNITIKIDVEGAEYDVLKGMEKTINANKPIIILEYFEKYPTDNYLNCLRFLRAMHYSPFNITAQGKLVPTTLQPKVADIVADSSDNIVFCYNPA
jgi:FkbM family methyltransferase